MSSKAEIQTWNSLGLFTAAYGLLRGHYHRITGRNWDWDAQWGVWDFSVAWKQRWNPLTLTPEVRTDNHVLWFTENLEKQSFISNFTLSGLVFPIVHVACKLRYQQNGIYLLFLNGDYYAYYIRFSLGFADERVTSNKDSQNCLEWIIKLLKDGIIFLKFCTTVISYWRHILQKVYIKYSAIEQLSKSMGIILIWVRRYWSKENYNVLHKHDIDSVQFSSVHLLSHVQLFATPWIAARQASLSITNSWSSLRLNVHRVSDAIQPSHPLLSPFPPAPNPSQHQSLFQWVSSSHEVAKVLEFQL